MLANNKDENSIKAGETQIKRQERSGSVVVVLFINYTVESQRKRFDRNKSVYSRALRERKERSRSLAGPLTNLHGASTALVLRCLRCCLNSTTFTDFLLRFFYAFTVLRVHGASDQNKRRELAIMPLHTRFY